MPTLMEHGGLARLLQRKKCGCAGVPACGQLPPLAEGPCALPRASHCWLSQGSRGLQNWDLSCLWVHCWKSVELL